MRPGNTCHYLNLKLWSITVYKCISATVKCNYKRPQIPTYLILGHIPVIVKRKWWVEAIEVVKCFVNAQ